MARKLFGNFLITSAIIYIVSMLLLERLAANYPSGEWTWVMLLNTVCYISVVVWVGWRVSEE